MSREANNWVGGGGDSAPTTPRPQEGTVSSLPNGRGYVSVGSVTNLNKGPQKPVEVVPTGAYNCHSSLVMGPFRVVV